MLPADGAYHLLSNDQTTHVLNELTPSVLIPLHYYVPELEEDAIEHFGPLNEWLRGRDGIRCLPANSWVASQETLPTEPEILALEIADSVYELNDVTPHADIACAEGKLLLIETK